METTEEFDPDLEVEAISYGKKHGFDKAGIVAEAVRNCCKKRAVEMCPGYQTHIRDKFGNVFLKVIPDSRKEYIGSIIALASLLTFEIRTHPKSKKEYEEFKKEEKKIKEKYLYSERTFAIKKDAEGKVILGSEGSYIFETIIVKGGKKWLPEKTELLPVPVTDMKREKSGVINKKMFIKQEMGIWNNNIDAYWDEMIELHGNLFSELNFLISGELKDYGKTLQM
ncbi:MAG: hypothetical protein KAQ92_00165 [Candidatus Aenigmarchaeota archaeon]|nr:hypothetical protein [Candidatus Aenigmarchaeota archaeon]